MESRTNVTMFPGLISYCCDISEYKEVSAIRHTHRVTLLCVQCVMTGKEITLIVTADKRSMTEKLEVRRKVAESFGKAAHESKMRTSTQ